jgi:hypothetical protein
MSALSRQTKRRIYSSDGEFEIDRRELGRGGWVVVERHRQPVGKPWGALDSGAADWAVYLVMAPLLFLGWLIFRRAPGEEIVVLYERVV